MSKIELLSPEEDAQAAAQGWGLFHVYDTATDKWVVQALGRTAPASQETGLLLVRMARTNDPLACRALQLISRSYQA